MALSDPVHLVVETLRAHPAETEWFEFKKGHFDANDFGEYVSALSNSAMLHGKPRAYIVFGIEDQTHNVVGTEVRLATEKIGTEPFELWLSHRLSPRINVTFEHCFIAGKRIEIACIEPAYSRPVLFINHGFIRIGSIKKRLLEYPMKEQTLWQITSRFSFEEGIAASHLSKADLAEAIYCSELALLIYKQQLTFDRTIEHFVQDGLLIDDMQGGYDVTNLLALAAARRLADFKTIAHKAPRVITYKTATKLTGVEDITGSMGYAIALPKILRHILKQGGTEERIGKYGPREIVSTYPEKAVREFLANALIHQDFIATGNPLVEIFADKIQFTNPGTSLVPPDRWIDAPAKSRNERLVNLMWKADLCESRGSGVDRAIWDIEKAMQAPPLWGEAVGSTVVTMFRNTNFAAMSKEDRVRACEQHATLAYLKSDPMSNSSLRMRLGLNKNQSSPVSNVISDAMAQGKIRPLVEDQGNRNARYVPAWAP